MAAADMGAKVPGVGAMFIRRSLLKTCTNVLLFAYVCHVQAQFTWRRTYGGFDSDRGACVKASSDGGYLVAGSTGSFGVGGDGYVLKLDAEGALLWSVHVGGSGVEDLWSLEATSTGGAVVVGSTSSQITSGYDGYAVEVDETGSILWEISIGSEEWEFLYDIVTIPGGFFAVGETYAATNGDADLWLLRLDDTGGIVWQRTIGGNGLDVGRSVFATADGGCVAAGSKTAINGKSDAYAVKYDANGSLEWKSPFGTDSADAAMSIVEIGDGSFLLCGSTRGYGENTQLMTARLFNDGSFDWMSAVGQLADSEAHEIRERQGGGFAVAGFTEAFGLGGRDMYLIVVDAAGQFQFGTTYGGTADDEAWGVDVTADGGFVLAGSTESFGPGPRAVFVVKAGPDGFTSSEVVSVTFDPVSIHDADEVPAALFSPNPLPPGGSIRFLGAMEQPTSYELYDAVGILRGRGAIATNSANLRLQIDNEGAYVLKIFYAQGISRSQRLIVTGASID
ncbi:MAG: hypothetical protein IPL52_02610 [Flavobacteriales bacterium]|nr:hypothetical protein [Flavobacteriales bacterium]